MKGRLLFFIFIFALLNAEVFASGKKDTAEVKPQNNEWVLCITNFETKNLPHDKAIVVPVITRKIVERFNTINYRTRISPEYAYYEDLAWSKERAAAAKAIETKMNERSNEIFKGDPRWRYNQNIVKIDKDLVKLRETLETIEKNAPVINSEPFFKLTSGNISSNFPDAPAEGEEMKFCAAQSADAFLTSSLIDFHGRFLLSMKLYIMYTQSYVWEDKVIFSQEDIDKALDEILQKLLVVLGGNEPAIINITAEPENTLLLINRSFAGRGSANNLEYPPSTITVTAKAPDHKSITFETSLYANEITDIKINLAPINYSDINVTSKAGGKIYHGALYVGDAPMTLRLPANNFEFIDVETTVPVRRSSETELSRGTIVFQTPNVSDDSLNFNVKTRPPLKKKRVGLDRDIFYWAWGSTWITGIAAWIASYSYDEAVKARNNGFTYYDLSSEISLLNNVRNGAFIAVGTAAVYTVYRFMRYLYTANRDSTPSVKPTKPKAQNRVQQDVETPEESNNVLEKEGGE